MAWYDACLLVGAYRVEVTDMTSWLTPVVVAVGVLLQAGCDEELAAPCQSRADCFDGQDCIDGWCQGLTDADIEGGGDAETQADAQPCQFPCGAGLCCEAIQRCFRDACIDDNGTCTDSDQCSNDTTCIDSLCVPFGDQTGDSDATCLRETVALESFEPELQCAWPGEYEITSPAYVDVRVPPLVGDLDGDGIPEIVFSSWSLANNSNAIIRAIRGDDCSPAWEAEGRTRPNQELTLGDVDGDGEIDVCSVQTSNVPFCLHGDGTLAWEGHDASGALASVPGCGTRCTVSTVNVDGSGAAELVAGLSVLDGVTGLVVSTYEPPSAGTIRGVISALADVDGDSHVEALTGGWVYDLVTGELDDWGEGHGYTAIAELSAAHAGTEVVAVSPDASTARVHALDGTVIFSHSVPGGSGGPPTVADLDGDGRAEFALASHAWLTAFDLDCVGSEEEPPDAEHCVNPEGFDGVMWSVSIHEGSSGDTGSSVFDFEGDGPVEIVYSDECWTRVFDGRTGAVKFSTPHESTTGIEYPTVADVDGDYFTEIVAPHERYDGGCPGSDPLWPEAVREGRYAGIEVYRDRQDRWAPSRSLWAEHAEHWTGRFDDGSVPATEMPSWEAHNSYRQALPSEDIEAAYIGDLTVRIDPEVLPECTGSDESRSQRMAAEVCNRGLLPVTAGAMVSFHVALEAGEACATEAVCSAETSSDLESGTCVEVQCEWPDLDVPLDTPYFVCAVVDEGSEIIECHEGNNAGTVEDQCPRPLI
jgi:hypothetical protein